MTEPTLSKAYDPKQVEEPIYAKWEEHHYFRPWNDPKDPGFRPEVAPFVISIPPPNITGELHLGSALFVSLEDLMIRYNRMKGIPTLWLPGTDHAGIATQLQVEKMLAKEGTSREAIGREEFLRRTWEWKDYYVSRIVGQFRRLGASADWSRQRFTLDEGLSRAVREAFVRLYEKDLIYRGPRMINWSPGLKTAVSDLEVEYSEEPGFLYYFKYRLADDPEKYLPVATTRPETILGDTAVAVHPDDPRYKDFVGKKVLVPVLNREIPVIADEYVDIQFGTGALKITPAHDKNDYMIGEKHRLPSINILTQDAKINENGGQYAGQDRFVCRKNIWADMKTQDLVIKEEPYTLNVPRSQRGGEIIEPMVSTQWFISIKPLADRALESVRSGDIKIVPEHFTKVYYNWLENIEDWCISRQLWWGHRIPVWYCKDCGEVICTREDPTSCPKCNSANLEQDPDVLDTWFSSGLWPFSTLGWPDKTPDLDYFYPTSIMETGYDILFFWVARMIMFGLEFTDKAPFHTVYLHGMVRDEHGKKMSKTNSNTIDPLMLMDEMGTDALRFTLLVGSAAGADQNLSEKKVEGNRNFINKLWNTGRFVLNAIDQAPKSAQGQPEFSLADSWIWAKLQTLVREVDRLFTSMQFGESGKQIYEFVWSDFADWYLEVAKLQLNQGGDKAYYTAQALAWTFDTVLRLLHPFIPFVTEELWGSLKAASLSAGGIFMPREGWDNMLIVARWPKPKSAESWEQPKVAQFELVQDLIRGIRNLRTEKKLQPSRKIPAMIAAGDKLALVQDQRGVIAALAGLDEANLTIDAHLNAAPADALSLTVQGIEVYLPLSGMIDSAEETARLERELAETKSQIGRLEGLLSSPFAQKAPAAVVDKERAKLEAYKDTLTGLEKQLQALWGQS